MKEDGNNIKALIAVPVFNEERNIQHLLSLLEPWKEDVLVIDDASRDKTVSLVTERGFTCYSRRSNVGLSGFYKTAKQHALRNNYTHLISLDGDGQHDPRFIPEFIEALHTHDLVSGNRFHEVSSIPPSKIASNLFAILLFKKFLNITLPDVACGFRAMNLKIMTETPFATRFGIIYDMLVIHSLAGRQIGFVRIPAIYHSDDQLNTKFSEIRGLLSTIYTYNPSSAVSAMIDSLNKENDFRINLLGFRVEAKYLDSGAYLFKINIPRARQFLNSIQQEIIQANTQHENQ